MVRGRIFSILFCVAAWLVLAAPERERSAFAEPAAVASDASKPDDAATWIDASAAPPWVPAEKPPKKSACPKDMVEVRGRYCTEVVQPCLAWLPNEQGGFDRCAQFGPTEPCKTAPVAKHFCVDRYEFPNEKGQRPLVMKTWTEAQDACRAIGKRLCGDSEWTLACEGNRRVPYPYGRKRDAHICNIDKSMLQVDEKAIADPKRRETEVARLWQGEPSGSRPDCMSPFGVFDMTGNVDEWVVNESGKPFKSGSKGGYWGPVRARCRPMTTAHAETFPFYQTGFRCCADPEAKKDGRQALAENAELDGEEDVLAP